MHKKEKLLVVFHWFEEFKSFTSKMMNLERRSPFQVKYKKMDIDNLKKSSSKVTPIKLTNFMEDYGRILSILNKKMDMVTNVIIAQFYDPLMCYFTFFDF